jgi:hypothetical protein
MVWETAMLPSGAGYFSIRLIVRLFTTMVSASAMIVLASIHLLLSMTTTSSQNPAQMVARIMLMIVMRPHKS